MILNVIAGVLIVCNIILTYKSNKLREKQIELSQAVECEECKMTWDEFEKQFS